MTDDDLGPVMVTLGFRTGQVDNLLAILANYVVVSRGQPGCRNIDLVASVTDRDRILVVQKWDSADAQRAHFDSDEMVEMARACDGLLSEPPDIDLYYGISMHDLT